MRRALLAAGTVLALAPAAHADTASLPATAGPPLLRDAPTVAPQLTNAGIWKASPILVSGAEAYRDGEFLYQDYLYDDHGADGGQVNGYGFDGANPQTGGATFSEPTGTYGYPTDPRYHGNAADLVELRVRPTASATAFRVTLNTLDDPSLVGFTIAIGGSSSPRPYPHGANVSGPAAYFLTVHGTTGELLDAADGKVVDAPVVQVDRVRRQFEVLVPHTAWDPGSAVVPMAAGVGLWDNVNQRYLVPGHSPTATTPGGQGDLSNPPAFFNVAFRTKEPIGAVNDPTTWNYWRDRAQAEALAKGDMSPFEASVDFGKLSAGTTDDSAVPTTGPMDRILSSRFDEGQGVDFSQSSSLGSVADFRGEYLGRLQPYAIYVPPRKPGRRYGLTLLLHALSANYNEMLGTRDQAEMADRGNGSIVITPEARGPDGFYYSVPLADVFEVWSDVARRYDLDPAFTDVSGYSMGGLGTMYMATKFPDLFARAFPIVGATAEKNPFQLPNLRNLPILLWNSAVDELVPAAEPEADTVGMQQDGLRYETDLFAPSEHLTLAYNDQYAPAAAFLGTAKVDPDPAHVTFSADPGDAYPKLDLAADHAYWVSGVTVRDTSAPSPTADNPNSRPHGTVDVLSHGFGVGDPTPSGPQAGAGVLTGGNLPALAYTRQFQTWGPAPKIPVEDRLDITATNVKSVTIDPRRAHVSCGAHLAVTTDGPLTVTLAGCGRSEAFK